MVPYQPEIHGYKSRQRTGSGGRLSASGITWKGYTKGTQNKARSRAALRGLPARGRTLACPGFIFIPVGILNAK